MFSNPIVIALIICTIVCAMAAIVMESKPKESMVESTTLGCLAVVIVFILGGAIWCTLIS